MWLRPASLHPSCNGLRCRRSSFGGGWSSSAPDGDSRLGGGGFAPHYSTRMLSIHSRSQEPPARMGYVHTSAQSVQAAACCTNLCRAPLVRMQWRPSAARLEARAILRSMSPPAHRVDARARAHVGASDADGRTGAREHVTSCVARSYLDRTAVCRVERASPFTYILYDFS